MLLRATPWHGIERGLRRRDSGGEVVGRDWKVGGERGRVGRRSRRVLDLLFDVCDVILVILEVIPRWLQVLRRHGQRMPVVILLHVTQHGGLEGKLLFAARMRTRIRFLLSVRLQVSVEVSLLRETLLAKVASVRFF